MPDTPRTLTQAEKATLRGYQGKVDDVLTTHPPDPACPELVSFYGLGSLWADEPAHMRDLLDEYVRLAASGLSSPSPLPSPPGEAATVPGVPHLAEQGADVIAFPRPPMPREANNVVALPSLGSSPLSKGDGMPVPAAEQAGGGSPAHSGSGSGGQSAGVPPPNLPYPPVVQTGLSLPPGTGTEPVTLDELQSLMLRYVMGCHARDVLACDARAELLRDMLMSLIKAGSVPAF